MSARVVPAAPAEGRVGAWCLTHLARPRPAQQFLPQIDGLRFVAIFSVVLYHLQGYVAAHGSGPASTGLQRLLACGHFGVPLFFAISGYIIAAQFLRPDPPSIARYFARRLTRLEPPYVISLLLVFAAKVVVLGLSAVALWPHLLASLVYMHNLVFGTQSLVNGVAWSLEVEWQFYLLAPVLFYRALGRRDPFAHACAIGLIAIGGLAHFIGIEGGPRYSLSILRFIGFFAAGVWVCMLDGGRDSTVRRAIWDVLGGISWAIVCTILLVPGVWTVALPGLTVLVLLSALRGPIFSRVLGWWPVYCIGAMCYTIYLYHFFVISLSGQAFEALFGWPASDSVALLAFGAFACPLVVVVCVVPYVLIERPFMAWRPAWFATNTSRMPLPPGCVEQEP